MNDNYVLIRVPTTEAAKITLNGLFVYVKSQWKGEMDRKARGSLKKLKFSDENGDKVIPFPLQLIKVENGIETPPESVSINYDLKKLKVSTFKYIPAKDRIPGEIYNGKPWFPKTKCKIVQDNLLEVVKQKDKELNEALKREQEKEEELQRLKEEMRKIGDQII